MKATAPAASDQSDTWTGSSRATDQHFRLCVKTSPAFTLTPTKEKKDVTIKKLTLLKLNSRLTYWLQIL